MRIRNRFFTAVLLLCCIAAVPGLAYAVTYLLTANVSPPGAGTLSFTPTAAGNIYEEGENVWITAVPNPGYALKNWTIAASGSDNPVMVTMDSDKSVTANMVAMHTLTADVNPPGSGSVLFSPTHPGNIYTDGEAVWISAVPEQCYRFDNWSGDIYAVVNPVMVTMDADKTITGNFSNIQCYNLITDSDPPGSATFSFSPTHPGNIYNEGEVVWITAVPGSGYRFDNWSGDAGGTINPVMVTMSSNITVIANCVPVHLLMAAINPNDAGTLSFSPVHPGNLYDDDETVWITATSNEGWNFMNWSNDATGTINPISINMDTDKTVTAAFTEDIDGWGASPILLTLGWKYSYYGSCIGETGISVYDVDGDGELEIVAAGSAKAEFADNDFWYVIKNAGNGEYVQVWSSIQYGTTISRIEVEDVDEDGTAEIFVGFSDSSIRIYNSSTLNEKGIYKLSGTLKAVADTDGDGDYEIITSNGANIGLYNSSTFALEWYSTSLGGCSITVGNVDGDSAPEIVSANCYTGHGYVVDGATHALEWDNSSGFGTRVETGDVDNDGIEEIVSSSKCARDIMIHDADSKTFAWSISTTDEIGSHIIADVDGDGVNEILYGDLGGINICCIDTSTRSQRWRILNWDGGATDLVIADTDEDGDLEILWGAGADHTGTDRLNIADISTQAIEWQSVALDGPLSAVDVGDVDDDGQDEIVMVSYGSNTQYLGIIHIFNAATHELKWRSWLPEAGEWYGVRSVRIADFDDDGDTEFAVTCSTIASAGAIYVYNGKTRSLEYHTAGYNGNTFTTMEAGDVDGDGRTEIVAGQGHVTSGASGACVIVFDGETGAQMWKSSSLTSWGEIYDIELSDIDDDGNTEIIASVKGRAIYVFDGVSKSLDWSSSYDAYALGVFDVDGDGDNELLVGRGVGNVDVLNGASYSLEQSYPLGSGPITGILIGDVNGDSTSEWFISEDDVLSVYESNTAELLWQNKWFGAKLCNFNQMSFEDIDNDGYKELVFGSNYALYQLETKGIFTSFITSPADDALLTGTSFNIAGSASVFVGAHVQAVDVSTDGGNGWDSATDTSDDGSWSSWSYQWTGVTDGTYNIKSRVTDDVPNQEVPHEGVTVTVDNTLPSSTITSPSDGAVLTSVLCVITGSSSDNVSGVQTVEVSTDGGTNWDTATDTSGNSSWSAWSYDWTYPASGNYTILSRATDNAGNVETPAPGISVTVQRTFQLTADVNPPGMGTLYFSPAASGNIYDEDETVWITTAPDAGWTFMNWTGDLSGSLNPSSIAMDADKYVAALIADVTPPREESYNPVWTRQLGSSGFDYCLDAVVDADGNTYACGITSGSIDGQTQYGVIDMYLAKYDADGNKKWTRQMGTVDPDLAKGVCIDANGYIYVCGSTLGDLDGYSNSGGQDVFVAKFDSGGNKIWTRLVGWSGSDNARDIAADADGNVYVCGETNSDLGAGTYAGGYDILLFKMDSDGNVTWSREYGTARMEIAQDVCVDAGGNIYLTGLTTGNLDPLKANKTADMFVVKYGSDGSRAWTTQTGTDDYFESAIGIAVDSSGNVLTCGISDGDIDGDSSTPGRIGVVKLDSSGNEVWYRQMGEGPSESASDIVVDAAGNFFICGYTQGGLYGDTNSGSDDFFVLKCDSSGELLWSNLIGSAASDTAYCIDIDRSGCVRVCGSTTGNLDGTNAGDSDMYVMKLARGAVSIDSGSVFTNSTSVSLSLIPVDEATGLAEMQISNDGVFDDEPWGTYAAAFSWSLLPGDGTKTVYARFKDGADNISASFTDSIILDAAAPASSITFPTDGMTMPTALGVYSITGTASDNLGGIQAVDISTDGGTNWDTATDTSGNGSWSTWSYDWSCTVKGDYNIRSRAADKAGNVETPGPGVNVTVPNHAPVVSLLSPSAGIYSDEMLYLSATVSDSDPADTIDQIEYGYSLDGTTWSSAGIDDTPGDPFHWYSGLDDVDVYLRARAYDGLEWGGWYCDAGTIQIENTDPVLIGPDHGTSRGAAFSDPSGPLVLDWSPNNCSKFTVYFSAVPFGGKAVKVKSDNNGYDPALTIPLKSWLKITRLGREIWWWVAGIAPDGARLLSAANLLILEGGFSAITDLPVTDVYAIPTLECDPGVNTVAGLQFSNEPYFLKPVKYPSRPVAVSGSLYSATPDIKSWSKITKLNHGVYWRFTGMLATGETTYSETNVLTITGGPAIDSHSDDDVATSAPTITWTDGGGFTGYQVQASASDAFPEKKPFNLGSTGGEKSLTVSAGTWESLKLLGDPVYIRVMGTTAEKYTAYSDPVRIYVNAP